MRAVAESSTLEAAPGSRVEVALDVVNTSRVIDGITARVIGLDPRQVTSRPALLPLFPSARGQLRVTIDVPLTFPSGRHPLTLELASSIEGEPPAHVDLDLVVKPRPALRLGLRPAVQRAHRRGRFLVECSNLGNVPLDVVLTADEPERVMRCGFSEAAVTVEPGATATSMLTLRARRRLLGSDLDRPVQVRATSHAHGIDEDVVATLRQRPLVARGVLTVVVLACIVGLWASAFLLGLTKVFASDPLTKTAPASFFVSAHGALALQAAVSTDDVLAKSGALPPGVGGGISGTVTAASTGAGTGRIVVEALRPTRTGPVLVVSAATSSDGTYALLGLLPGRYLLRFSAPGYRTSWYPSAAGQAGARLVDVAAQTLHRGADSNVSGLPSSITGTVDPGDTLHRPRTVVTARSLQGGSTQPVAQAATDAHGGYVLRGLPAPGTYELGFTTPGYAPLTVLERVEAGQARSEPSVRLSAGEGSITGDVVQVTGGQRQGLGDVSVTTTEDDKPVATATPTTGQVGHFALTGLPTPGTYVVTFSKPGYGAFTQTIDLSPGENKALTVSLRSGTGTVDGDVVDSVGHPLGGVSVAVGGAPAPLTTTTLTDGVVGHYSLSGLPVPGSYTLTFTRAGFAPQTAPIMLDGSHPAARASATLTLGVGRVIGRVYDAGTGGVVGATVTVTDGLTPRTATTVGGGPATGGAYIVGGLLPGTYTVSVSGPGLRPQTALVTVAAARDSCQNLRAVASSAAAGGDPPPCA